ncbi:MAG: recombinase family protein [Rectinemataceae bacterium]|nr:recombinase family protein [Rectinemataceae bacterium]
MEKKPPVRAVGYVRVSTEEQASSGLSMSHQKTRIIAFAKATDFRLLEVIAEPGKSAKNLKRPGLTRALGILEGGEAQALVVLSLDRLTRSVKDLGYLVEFFDRTGTALVSVQDSINTLTAAGRLVLNVLGSIAQWEREAIAERTSAAMAVKRSRGEKTGGMVPFGYDADKSGCLSPNIREQEALKLIVRLRKRGYSLRRIGKRLTALGLTPKQGKSWHPQVIKQILELVYKKRHIEYKHVS